MSFVLRNRFLPCYLYAMPKYHLMLFYCITCRKQAWYTLLLTAPMLLTVMCSTHSLLHMPGRLLARWTTSKAPLSQTCFHIIELYHVAVGL